MENRPTSRSRKGHAGKTEWKPAEPRAGPTMEGTSGAADGVISSRKHAGSGPRAGSAAQAVSLGGEPRESRLAGQGASAPSPGGLVKGLRRRGFVRLAGRDSNAPRDRERRLLQPTGPRDHDRRCLGNVGLGSALSSTREIAAQDGARHGESRDHGPLIHGTPAGSLRKRRDHLETASGEGNFTAARVTSRIMESGFGRSS